MTGAEMELHVEELEGLLDDISDALDDPELTDAEAREEIRALLAGENDDE